jgi:hypothetical protein
MGISHIIGISFRLYAFPVALSCHNTCCAQCLGIAVVALPESDMFYDGGRGYLQPRMLSMEGMALLCFRRSVARAWPDVQEARPWCLAGCLQLAERWQL